MQVAGKQKSSVGREGPIAWLAYFALRVVICILQALPIEACETFASCMAVLANDVLRIRGRLVEENLRHAFPQADARQRRKIAFEMWKHLVLMICELAHIPRKLHDSNWRDYIEMSEDEVRTLVGYLLSPRPVVIVSGHYGNFEVGGIVSGLLGFPTYTVARPLDNVYLHRYLTDFRERTGQFMLEKQGSAGQIDDILRSGGTMVLLGDQSAGPKGVWVQFFGRPASCHKAVALFSLVNDAPMLLAHSIRARRPFHFRIGVSACYDPARESIGGMRQLTQSYNDHLEAIIRVAPEQYWWLHRRWKAKPVRKGGRRMDPSQDRAEPHAHGKSAETTVLNQLEPHRPSQANQAPDQHPSK